MDLLTSRCGCGAIVRLPNMRARSASAKCPQCVEAARAMLHGGADTVTRAAMEQRSVPSPFCQPKLRPAPAPEPMNPYQGATAIFAFLSKLGQRPNGHEAHVRCMADVVAHTDSYGRLVLIATRPDGKEFGIAYERTRSTSKLPADRWAARERRAHIRSSAFETLAKKMAKEEQKERAAQLDAAHLITSKRWQSGQTFKASDLTRPEPAPGGRYAGGSLEDIRRAALEVPGVVTASVLKPGVAHVRVECTTYGQASWYDLERRLRGVLPVGVQLSLWVGPHLDPAEQRVFDHELQEIRALTSLDPAEQRVFDHELQEIRALTSLDLGCSDPRDRHLDALRNR